MLPDSGCFECPAGQRWNHFQTRAGELWCEGVALSAVAEAVGTPVYVYSRAQLLQLGYRALARWR